jgi:hypothetical protein
MNKLVAGGLYGSIHDMLRPWLVRRWELPRRGRRRAVEGHQDDARSAQEARSPGGAAQSPGSQERGPRAVGAGADALRVAS